MISNLTEGRRSNVTMKRFKSKRQLLAKNANEKELKRRKRKFVSKRLDGVGHRASHVPSKKTRKDVMFYKACGMSEDAIASVIGISRPTLREHYAFELHNGHAISRAENLSLIKKSAGKGNGAAQRYLDKRMNSAAVAMPDARPPVDPPVDGEQPVLPSPSNPPLIPAAEDAKSRILANPELKLGKKEQRALRAEVAEQGTEWDGLINVDVNQQTESVN